MVTSPRRLAIGLLLATVATAGSGCAVGYGASRPEPEPGTGAEDDRTDWSSHAFVVPESPRLRWAAGRVLRLRHGVVSIRTGAPKAGAFTLSIEPKEVTDGTQVAMMASFLTLAVLPGWYTARTEHRFTLTAPDGAVHQGLGETSSLEISWLPFLLFGPTTMANLNDATDDHAIDGLEASEEVLARFLAGAAAFVAAHGGDPAVPP